LETHEHPEGRLGERPQVDLADSASRERLHRPRPLERVDIDDGVEDRQGLHPVWHRGGQLESDRTAEVVDDKMKVLQLERVDGGCAVATEPGPRVVEVFRPVGEP